jgi:hypothetical protein
MTDDANTHYLHAKQDMKQIRAAFDEVIEQLHRCLPTADGKSTGDSALVLQFNHHTGDLLMSGLNADHDDVRTLLMVAFNRTFEKEIDGLQAAVEAKVSKPTFN